MTHLNLAYTHVPTSRRMIDDLLGDEVGLYVISDYPASNFSVAQIERIGRQIEAGAGIIMLGGWQSYHGRGGDWDRTALAERLPVRMHDVDDRRNSAQPTLVRVASDHAILSGLPWSSPPTIGGYNAFEARPGATVVLEGERYRVSCAEGPAEFSVVERFPLLVVQGRAACLATDVAPHWVGGLVDWGDPRLVVEWDGDRIEVGRHYARLFGNLLSWGLGELEGPG
jgi:uncharacterized membrane protein